MNEKTKRILLLSFATIVILPLVYYGASIFIYQSLVKEGSVLADNQCLHVNPIIIDRKNSYIKSIEALKANDFEEYERQTDAYFAASEKYVTEQSKWLDTQKKYMDRWDFKYFNPSYVKAAAKHQYDSRNADTESTKLLIESYQVSQLNKSLAEEIAQKSVNKIKERNEADRKYDEIWDNPGKLDWRTRFIKVPPSKCPDKNFDIPDVDNFLNPETSPGNPDAPLS